MLLKELRKFEPKSNYTFISIYISLNYVLMFSTNLS